MAQDAGKLAELQAKLAALKDKFNALKETFVASYPKVVQAAKDANTGRQIISGTYTAEDALAKLTLWMQTHDRRI